MRNDKNNIINRKKDVILALLFVLILMFSCVTNVFAIDPEEETTEIQATLQNDFSILLLLPLLIIRSSLNSILNIGFLWNPNSESC